MSFQTGHINQDMQAGSVRTGRYFRLFRNPLIFFPCVHINKKTVSLRKMSKFSIVNRLYSNSRVELVDLEIVVIEHLFDWSLTGSMIDRTKRLKAVFLIERNGDLLPIVH